MSGGAGTGPAASAIVAVDWPAPARVRACYTQRAGAGVSTGAYARFNLGAHVGDDPAAVAANRRALAEALALPAPPRWLHQVHGSAVVELGAAAADDGEAPPPTADAAVSRCAGVVCALLTADCLPVLMCDRAGSVVGAAHAGWRGLAAGVLEATVAAMGVAPASLLAWLGPAISAPAFEVGDEVRAAFLAAGGARAAAAFTANARGRWQADLALLARQRLQALGVAAIGGPGPCTAGEADRFFSHRRDGGRTGRMASLVWLAP